MNTRNGSNKKGQNPLSPTANKDDLFPFRPLVTEDQHFPFGDIHDDVDEESLLEQGHDDDLFVESA